MENWFSVGISLFQIGRDLTRKVIFGAGELGIQVKMITGDHVSIAKETCRVTGMETKIPTINTPAIEADTLRDRFGEFVEGCDGFCWSSSRTQVPDCSGAEESWLARWNDW